MDDRMIRQTLLIPQDMKNCTVVLVGLGMLGSWTAHALSRTCRTVVGYDFDVVGPENVGTQAYNVFEQGVPKVVALQASLTGLSFKGIDQQFDSSVEVPWGDTFSRSLVVVSAVDSMAGRRMVAEWATKHGASLFIDTRAHGTVGVVIALPPYSAASFDEDFDENNTPLAMYLDTLESDDAVPAPACGAEGTAFVGMWVAQQVTSSILRHFKGLPVPYKVVREVAMDCELLREEVPGALV